MTPHLVHQARRGVEKLENQGSIDARVRNIQTGHVYLPNDDPSMSLLDHAHHSNDVPSMSLLYLKCSECDLFHEGAILREISVSKTSSCTDVT